MANRNHLHSALVNPFQLNAEPSGQQILTEQPNRQMHLQSTYTQQSAQRASSPQVRIYNRYFYKKENEQALLQEQQLKEIKMTANIPKITPNSYAILSRQTYQQLESKIRRIVKQDPIQFDEIALLVQSYLGVTKTSREQQECHIVSEQLYLLMCHYDLENDPKLEDLFSVMRVLLDPYGHSLSEQVNLIKGLPTFSDIEEKRLQFVKSMPDCESQTLTIYQLLQLWRQHKLKSNDYKKRTDPNLVPVIPSFTPVINKKSEALASRKTERVREEIAAAHTVSCKDLSHHELLYHQRLEKNTPRLQIQTQPSFRPQINQTNHERDSPACSQDVVDRLYHIPCRTSRNIKQFKQQQQLKLCTFKPKLQASTPRTPSTHKSVSNFDKTVGRLAVARQRKKELKMAYETLGKVRNPSKNRTFQPPSMLERSEPKVILEIKVDEYRIEKVKLYGGEDPHLVASRFVRKNNLGEEMLEVVEDLIREYSEKYMN